MLMNKLSLLVLALAVATAAAVGDLYMRSPAALPMTVTIARKSVVKVNVYDQACSTCTVKNVGHGSGVIVAPNLVITCNHVTVHGNKGLGVLGFDRRQVPGHVVLHNPAFDLALIKIDQPVGPAITLGDNPVSGDLIIVVGHPGRFEWLATYGMVSSTSDGIIVSDVVVNPGNSGGGMFDRSARLVGIADAIAGPFPLPFYQGHSIFVPVEHVKNTMRAYERKLARERKK